MNYNYLKNCPYCKNILEVDDIDYDFKGKQDEFLICNNCNLYFTAKIRFGKIWKVIVERIKD